MKIIVKDAQEAIEVAEKLQKAAGSVCFDMELNDAEIEALSDYFYRMRNSIEVVND